MTTAAAPPAPDPSRMRDLAETLSRYGGEPDYMCADCALGYTVTNGGTRQCPVHEAAAALRAAAHEQDRLAAIETAANGVAHYWGGGGPGMRYTSGAWTPDFAEAMTVLHAALLAAPSDAAGDDGSGS